MATNDGREIRRALETRCDETRRPVWKDEKLLYVGISFAVFRFFRAMSLGLMIVLKLWFFIELIWDHLGFHRPF